MYWKIHSATQLPLTISIIMVGVLVLMRSHDNYRGAPAPRSSLLTFLIGIMIVLLGIKQAIWGAVWAIKSSGAIGSMDDIIATAYIPTICNFLVILIAGAIITLAAKPFLGKWSPMAVSVCLLGLATIQIVIQGGAVREISNFKF